MNSKNMKIYPPSEDSYFMQESLKQFLQKIKDKSIMILDMGTGSGIQAKTCKELGFKNIIGADINKEAIKNIKIQGLKAIHSDLFSKIKNKKFNLIIFNPPYLPEDKFDKESDTTAGKQGYELIIEFIKQAKSYLKKEGSILLLVSSLSHPSIIKKQSKYLGYKLKLLNKKKLFFEQLFLYEISLNF